MRRSLALQLKIAGAFAAVVVGCLGSVAYVPIALQHFTLRAERVQQRNAEEVRVLSGLRGCGREIRTAALLAFLSASESARVVQEENVSRARERCATIVAAYTPVLAAEQSSASVAGRSEWRQFITYDLPDQEAAVDAVLTASRGATRDGAAVRRLFELAERRDANLEKLLALQAARVNTDAEQIHRGLERLSWWYLVLAAVGAFGASVLLIESIALVRRFARSTDERLADLDAFAGHVAHDLRSPLQTIQLAVSRIARASGDPAVQVMASRASAGVKRLDGMISDLLEFARSSVEASDPHAITDVSSVIRDVLEEHQAQATGVGVQLVMRPGPPARAVVAPVALKAIVANLVDNAIKYRNVEHDGKVVVATAVFGDEVEIVVRDNGIGIRTDILPSLFKPFVRGSKRPDSYGLGLATVKRLVDAHHGTVSVESEEGRGSTFVVRLPAELGFARPDELTRAPALFVAEPAPHENTARVGMSP